MKAFTKLKTEKAKQTAIYEYANKVNPMLSEYEIICELCAKPYTYNFNSKGILIRK
jgi:hypothetical protein